MPPNTIYVGRPSKWGNPYSASTIDMLRYELHIKIKRMIGKLDLNELKDKDLACWCPLYKNCHADILIKLVNENDQAR